MQSSFVCFCSSLYFLCSLEVMGLFVVCASVVCALFAAGYAFDFGGDPRLVEACCGEFAGDVLFM